MTIVCTGILCEIEVLRVVALMDLNKTPIPQLLPGRRSALGWVKSRDTFHFIHCIIVYVTNKAHLSLIIRIRLELVCVLYIVCTIVKWSWDGLPEGRNCFCAWLFWCSELCSVDQTATVQRGSVLGVSGEGCTNDSLSSPDYPPYSIRRSDDLIAELNHSYWCDTRSDSHNCPFSCPFKRTRSQRLSEDFTLIVCAKISLPHISGLYHDGRWTNSVTT